MIFWRKWLRPLLQTQSLKRNATLLVHNPFGTRDMVVDIVHNSYSIPCRSWLNQPYPIFTPFGGWNDMRRTQQSILYHHHFPTSPHAPLILTIPTLWCHRLWIMLQQVFWSCGSCTGSPYWIWCSSSTLNEMRGRILSSTHCPLTSSLQSSSRQSWDSLMRIGSQHPSWSVCQAWRKMVNRDQCLTLEMDLKLMTWMTGSVVCMWRWTNCIKVYWTRTSSHPRKKQSMIVNHLSKILIFLILSLLDFVYASYYSVTPPICKSACKLFSPLLLWYSIVCSSTLARLVGECLWICDYWVSTSYNWLPCCWAGTLTTLNFTKTLAGRGLMFHMAEMSPLYQMMHI